MQNCRHVEVVQTWFLLLKRRWKRQSGASLRAATLLGRKRVSQNMLQVKFVLSKSPRSFYARTCRGAKTSATRTTTSGRSIWRRGGKWRVKRDPLCGNIFVLTHSRCAVQQITTDQIVTSVLCLETMTKSALETESVKVAARGRATDSAHAIRSTRAASATSAQ